MPSVVRNGLKKKSVLSKDLKSSKNRKNRFNIYIRRILKQQNPTAQLTPQARDVLNSFANDVFDRVGAEAVNLIEFNTVATLKKRHVKAAMQLLMPGELGKHAILLAEKAVKRYDNSKKVYME